MLGLVSDNRRRVKDFYAWGWKGIVILILAAIMVIKEADYWLPNHSAGWLAGCKMLKCCTLRSFCVDAGQLHWERVMRAGAWLYLPHSVSPVLVSPQETSLKEVTRSTQILSRLHFFSSPVFLIPGIVTCRDVPHYVTIGTVCSIVTFTVNWYEVKCVNFSASLPEVITELNMNTNLMFVLLFVSIMGLMSIEM